MDVYHTGCVSSHLTCRCRQVRQLHSDVSDEGSNTDDCGGLTLREYAYDVSFVALALSAAYPL